VDQHGHAYRIVPLASERLEPIAEMARVVAEIASQAGRQFDPDLVSPFLALLAYRHG